jgi:hypothetical protein
MLKPIPVWLVATSLLLCSSVEVRAGYVTSTLGAAGPGSFGVLSLSTTSQVGLNAAATSVGNVGISSPGVVQLTGASSNQTVIQGNVYLGNKTALKYYGAQISGSVFPNQSTYLAKAEADAINASKTFAALAPTQTVAKGQITRSQTLTGAVGINVLNVSNITLGSGQVLTFGGPAGSQWVINDSGALGLSGAKIMVTGGVTASDVVFNFTYPSTTILTGGWFNNSVLNGILLAPKSPVWLYGSTINGELIGGGSALQLNSGAAVNGIPPSPSLPVTPAPSSLVLMSLGAVALAGLVIRSRRQQLLSA